MDNDQPRAPVVSFVPDRRFTAGAGAGALVALAALLIADDAAGRLLAALTALVLLAYVASDLVFSPRLVVSAQGLVIRSVLTRAQVPWDEVESVHADSRARLGLRSTTLEIDAGATLAVFSRRALGSDPQAAAGLIRSFQPWS